MLSGCSEPRYRGFRRVLAVRVDEVDTDAGTELTKVDERARFVLKDAAGAVVAEQRATTHRQGDVAVFGADFDVLGATACVLTGARADADAGRAAMAERAREPRCASP